MARSISAEVGIEPNTKVLIKELYDDNVRLRASLAALLAKLDLDATVTDTNYAALCAPAASNLST